VADVVQECRHPRQHAFVAADRLVVVLLLEQGQGTTGEVIGAKRVLEPGVSGARVHQEREAELAYVAQPLERWRVDQLGRQGVEPDVVPERIADDFHGHGPYDTWATRAMPHRNNPNRSGRNHPADHP
jgi:hypothetical protein